MDYKTFRGCRWTQPQRDFKMIADNVECGGTKNGDNITFPDQNGNTS